MEAQMPGLHSISRSTLNPPMALTSSPSYKDKEPSRAPQTPGFADPGSLSSRRPINLSRTQTQTTGGIFTPITATTANQSPSREPIDETARTNALWAEMRATLAEVELSAAKGNQQTHFFGPHHATALEELRNAQIALAQAWAKADDEGADEAVETQDRKESPDEDVSPGNSVAADSRPGLARGTDENRHRASSAASNASSSLDAEGLAAERDIATAKLRREANDRYFLQVSQGVMDVVGKLEEVAKAMGSVEKASRSVWSDEEDSDDTERPSKHERDRSGEREKQKEKADI